MPYSTETPWAAVIGKKRAAAERAEDRAKELRAQADAIELRQRDPQTESADRQ